MKNILVAIRGGGDLASGVAARLFHAGFKIIILELEFPTAIRLPVSFARAVYEGKVVLEDIEAAFASCYKEAISLINQNKIAVLTDPEGKMIKKYFFIYCVMIPCVYINGNNIRTLLIIKQLMHTVYRN